MLFHEGLEQNIFTIGAQYELMAIDAPKTLFWHRLLIICIEMRPINPAINNAKWDRGNHGGEIRGSLPAKRDAGEISKLETWKVVPVTAIILCSICRTRHSYRFSPSFLLTCNSFLGPQALGLAFNRYLFAHISMIMKTLAYIHTLPSCKMGPQWAQQFPLIRSIFFDGFTTSELFEMVSNEKG